VCTVTAAFGLCCRSASAAPQPQPVAQPVAQLQPQPVAQPLPQPVAQPLPPQPPPDAPLKLHQEYAKLFFGVRYDEKRKARPYRSRFGIGKDKISNGSHDSAIDAAKATDFKLRRHNLLHLLNFDNEANFIRLRQLKPVGATSKFLGVSWHEVNRKWRASLLDWHGGEFDTEIAAAKAVDLWLRDNGRAAEANFDLNGKDTKPPLAVPFQPPPVSFQTPTSEDLARTLLG
jgi:hypothetical protein